MGVVTAIVTAISATVSSIAAGAAAAGAMVAAGAATAAGMAAVGSALVSLSTVIGVAGLATSVIGMATGNKDLLKAGKVMGYIGLGSAVLGGVTGGISGLMEGGAGFMEGVKGAFTGAAAGGNSPSSADVDATGGTMFSSESGTSVTSPLDGMTSTAPDTSQAMTSVPGVSQQSQIYTANPQAYAAGSEQALSSPIEASSMPASTAANTGVAGSPDLQAPITGAPDMTTPISATGSPVPPDAGANYQSLADSASQAPAPPTVATPQAPAPPSATPIGEGPYALDTSANPLPGYTPPPANASVGQNYTMEGLKQMADPFKAASPAAPSAPSMWASMPEWAKYAAMTSGVQGLTGLASGYYQGLSAEEKLKFEKLVNDQRQQQVEVMNTRSAYAPRVRFNRAAGGLVNA